MHNSGASRREVANVRLGVIASAAKQSILSSRGKMDLLRFARNDGRGSSDCFAEPVIEGVHCATRRPAMTVSNSVCFCAV